MILALLKLKKHIAFSENVHSLCLTTDSSKISSIGLVSGYGMNNENYSVAVKPDILQAAHLPVWNNQDCRDRYANKSYSISERQICAGGTNGIDSCYSDSGKEVKFSIYAKNTHNTFLLFWRWPINRFQNRCSSGNYFNRDWLCATRTSRNLYTGIEIY